MKRYTAVVHKQRPVGIYVPALAERDDGNAVLFADIQARDLKLVELARALPHDYTCATRLPGIMVGGISFDVNQPPYAHEVKHECDCPRGELLAMLETTNG